MNKLLVLGLLSALALQGVFSRDVKKAAGDPAQQVSVAISRDSGGVGSSGVGGNLLGNSDPTPEQARAAEEKRKREALEAARRRQQQGAVQEPSRLQISAAASPSKASHAELQVQFGDKPQVDSHEDDSQQREGDVAEGVGGLTIHADPQPEPQKTGGSWTSTLTFGFLGRPESDNSELLGTVQWTAPTSGDKSGISTHTYNRIKFDRDAKKAGKACSEKGFLRYKSDDTGSMLKQAFEHALATLPAHVRKAANDSKRNGADGAFDQMDAFIAAANGNENSFSNRRDLRVKLRREREHVLACAKEEFNRIRSEVDRLLQIEHALDENTKRLTTSRPTTPDSLEAVADEEAFLNYMLSKNDLPQLPSVE